MAVLHPPHLHVTPHDWDTANRPEIASVLDIIRSQPLPASAATQVTLRVAHCRPERRALVAEGDIRIDATRYADDVLSDLDFVESLLAGVRKLYSLKSDADSPRLGVPSLVPYLVSTCMLKCWDNVLVHDAAWIALRKLPAPLTQLTHLAEKYRRIPLLVTLPLLPHLHVQHTFIPPLTEGSEGSSADELSEDAAPLSDLSKLLAAGMKLVRPERRYEWMELPIVPRSLDLQRNVFAADSPLHSLCALVVADRETLFDAMSSALYHRLSWGVRGALVGLSYSPDSTLINLHLGWLEDKKCSPDELPQVHVLGSLSPMTSRDGRQTGFSFSLAHAEDVISLARVLLSLKSYFEEDVRAATLVGEDRIPRWRADQEITPPSATAGWDSIEEWRCRIQTGPVPDTPSPNYPGDYDLDLGLSAAYPFNSFVALREKQGSLPTATSLWLLDRLVVYHSLPPVSLYHDPTTYGLLDDDAIRPHVPIFALYRRATQFVGPNPWLKLRCLPSLPRALRDLGRELYYAFDTSNSQVSHRVAASDFNDEASSILEQELATVLGVTSLARSLNSASTAQSYQYLYDMAFSILRPRTAAQIVPGAAIRLSRSNIYDIVSSASGDGILGTVRFLQRSHYLTQDAEARLFEHIDTDRYNLLNGAVRRASRDENDRRLNLDSVRQRVLESPTSGRCDVALVARFSPPSHAGVGPQSLPNIIIGQSLSPASRTYPVPYWPIPETFGSPDATQRVLTFDILASAHQDYPAASYAEIAKDDIKFSYRTDAFTDTTGRESVPQPENRHSTDVPVLLVVHSV